MEEVWKEYFVQDYGNIYVSNYGNVKNKKGKLLLKRQKQKSDYLNPYYYIRVNYTKDGKRKIWQQYIHRLVAICFIDNPENKLEVNHIDGNKLNNNVSNLEWVTRKENMIHAKNKNLLSDKSCENNGRSKLTKEQVIDTNGSGHGALAGLLSELEVDVLICGGIGGGAKAYIR